MEDNQLNLNRPLLSVRRFSSTVARQDAAHRRKVDSSHPIIPSSPAYRSELKSGPVRDPGTVPFQWEQSPGRPKDERKLQNHPSERPPVVPKLPPGRTINARKHDSNRICNVERVVQSKTNVAHPSCQNIMSSNIDVGKDDISSDEFEEKSCSDSDYDEAYLDAVESLSRTESSLARCLSSLSRLDGPDMEASAAFLTDPQTLDIMMGRFLPAAKAMVSESPQRPTRKKSTAMVQEPPREVIKAVNKIKPHLVKRQPLDLLRHHMENEAGDSEDEIDDYVEPDYLSAKMCGLLPRLKNSLCLLNPIPGLRMQSAAPIPAGHRSRIGCTFIDSFGGTESQLAKDVAYEQELKSGHQNQDLHVDNMLRERDHMKLDGLSPYRHLQGTTLPSCQNNRSGNPKVADNSWNKELDPQRKGPCLFRELLAIDQNDECGLPSICPVVEKTGYIDPVHKIESQNSKFSSPKESPNCKQEYCSTRDEHTKVTDLSHQDFEHLNGANAILAPKTSMPGNSSVPSLVNVKHDIPIDMKKISRQYPDILQSSPQVPDDIRIDLEKRVPKNCDKSSTNGTFMQLSLPLPNSPSESWLQRTLPTLSFKNSSKSSFGTGNDMKNQSSKSPLDPKWETLVKTSNTYHGHLRFSEELLTPIPEA